MPLQRAEKLQRGFSLMELLVVISILIVMVLVFMTAFLGASTTPLESAGLKISVMTTNIRQNAAVRKTHGELVLDYKNDRVISLSRERLVTFAFESDGLVGSNQVLGRGSTGVSVQKSRTRDLLDGGALQFDNNQASFTVP
ncbi:MAG: prepilin-type N-terminal cleavage/methylation domain-containing protein, partial [Planctomycetes bacterium]|nr:prepilin-type N-terminal cleavage/methylation domain-containing protein [Planctomycetota bacterium]